MKLKKVIDNQGAFLIPKWYGVAYHLYDCDRTVLYIIPFNLIAKWIFLLRIYIKHGGWDFRKKQNIYMELEKLRAENKKLMSHIRRLKDEKEKK